VTLEMVRQLLDATIKKMARLTRKSTERLLEFDSGAVIHALVIADAFA